MTLQISLVVVQNYIDLDARSTGITMTLSAKELIQIVNWKLSTVKDNSFIYWSFRQSFTKCLEHFRLKILIIDSRTIYCKKMEIIELIVNPMKFKGFRTIGFRKLDGKEY